MSDNCTNCDGSGAQPEGWKLRDAQENPKGYNAHRLEVEYGPNHNVMALLSVVSPLQFLADGREKCVKCHGTGVSPEATMRKEQETRDNRISYFRKRIGGGTSDVDSVLLPDGMMFITICAYFDNSDVMTDYFAPHQTLSDTYVLTIVKKGPRTEKKVRSVVESIPELAKLNWSWHKQDWSGGHGAWLQSGVIGSYPYRKYDGRTEAAFWYEVSFDRYSRNGMRSKLFVNQKTQVSAPTVSSVPVDGVVVRKNEEKKGIEIQFPSKPGADVIQLLKDEGFRWSQAQGIWWRKFDTNLFEKMKNKFSI